MGCAVTFIMQHHYTKFLQLDFFILQATEYNNIIKTQNQVNRTWTCHNHRPQTNSWPRKVVTHCTNIPHDSENVLDKMGFTVDK